MIAITDHGLNMPGGPHEYYFSKIIDLPCKINGVELLKDVEANIIDINDNLDMPVRLLQSLDLVLAGFHADTGYQGDSISLRTESAQK